MTHGDLIRACIAKNPGSRLYEHSEPPADAGYIECPIENVLEGENSRDPCEGCPGWGYECGAVWMPPNERK